MATRKRPTARKTTAKKTTRKTTAKRAAQASAAEPTAETQSGPVRVEAGGIDPRLVEARERQKAEESGIQAASPRAATIDPKLLQIRERTIKRQAELANRSTTKPPARG